MTATAALLPQTVALDDPRWRRFVASSPDATPFHDPAWALLLAQTYGYRGFALAMVDGHGRWAGGLPFLEVRSLTRRRRWISLPFTDQCPPLALDASAHRELQSGLAGALASLRAPPVQLRGAIGAEGWHVEADAVIHELELDPDVDRVRAGFSQSRVVRNIRRAEREGVMVRRGTSHADLEAFYALHTRTRQRQGAPVQPRRFFELMWSRLVVPGLAHVLLADAGGRGAIAGALFLIGGGTTIYKFGASDVESWPLRPNHLIFWSAIQQACGRGDRRFDFGRSDLGNHGLRSFKTGWGAQERPLRYSTLQPDALAGAPDLAARAIAVAIRRGPEWVCRGAGEAFYRFAASR